MSQPSPPGVPIRREPPPFRRAGLRNVTMLSPHMVRVTVGGPDLDGLLIEQPAASVRLLLPSAGAGGLVIPIWNGNEFLLPDGRRPVIRTLTPRRLDSEALDLDLEIVVHDGGAASAWASAATASPDDQVAVSGPARGYTVDPDAPAFLLAGDETAIPAISQLLEVLPATTPVLVHIEVAHPDGRVALPDHPMATVTWCDRSPDAPPGAALFDAVRSSALVDGVRVWAAGEAAAVQRIRRYLFEERGLSRAQASVRGYWKHGRAGEVDDA